MAESLRKPATWSDLLVLPEGESAEVLEGELYSSPRPQAAHGRTQMVLSADLGGPFDLGRGGPGGWWIVVEPDVRFGVNDIASPDLAGWRRARMPTFPTERPIDEAPDWICEVLSPATARRDRTIKANLYLRGGVSYYWLIDPDLRTLEALEAHGGAWIRRGAWGDGEKAAIPPFAAVTLTISDLFPPLPS